MPNNTEHKLIKHASYLSVIIAAFILVIKTYAWQTTDSQSMLASLVDSMFDISSSLINLVVIRIALQPPDHNHRFGHEKFQDLAIFSQSMFFCASSVFTVASSIHAMFSRRIIANSNNAIYSMCICILLTLLLVCYQSYVINKTQSKIIVADKLHYFTDFLTNIVVVISICLSSKFWWVDSLLGICISIYVAYSCYSLFSYAIKNLVDEEMTDQDKSKILSIIANYSQVKGVHDLKTRYAATKPFIQFHIEMDGGISLNEAHSISEQISNDLLTIFANGDIIIHQDPAGDDEKVSSRETLRF